MKEAVIQTLLYFARCFDFVFAPLSLVSALWCRYVRSAGFERMMLARKIFLSVGVLPIRRHYYEPFYDPDQLEYPADKERKLPGINLRETEQVTFLDNLQYADELLNFPLEDIGTQTFFYNNTFFAPGDAEFLYAMIRYLRPRRIIEVGSGNSTLMMLNALEANKIDDSDYVCDLTCIEPYEAPWLEDKGVTVIRKCVEKVDITFFSALQSGDILFIDSSHVIKPQGDILFLFLEVLPQLQHGVFVHIHDILTPRDYFHQWVVDKIQLWNEQYLVESFLTLNREFAIVAALNFLKHSHFERLASICPILAMRPVAEPGSLWLKRL